jgi:hypothetical protein
MEASMRIFGVVVFVVALLLCPSCGTFHEAVGTISELQQVHKAISRAVGTNDVNINLSNGKLLVISLVNSPLKDLPVDQKKAKALELAQLGYRSYPEMAKLAGVSVVFLVQRSYVGVFHYTDGSDAFKFVPSELESVKSADGEKPAQNVR